MFDLRFLHPLRQGKGWSQADVAGATRINQPRVSLYERRGRRPTKGDWTRMERALALGVAREGESEPVFALATRSAASVGLALSDGPRIGVYRDSRIASEAARTARRLTARDDLGVVPVWLEAAFAEVIAWKAAGGAPADVYVVDESPDKTKTVAAVTGHALAVADWLNGTQGSAGSHVGALADAFLEQSQTESAAA